MDSTLLHVERIDPKEFEVQSVAAWSATAQVWEDEECAGNASLVFCLVWAGDEGPHQSAGGLHVGGGGWGLGFVFLVGWVEQGAVQCEHAVVVLLWTAGCFVGDLEFEDGRRVDDSSIALAESACSCCYRLLTYCECVVQWR